MSILCFHTVEPEWDRTLALTPEAFDETCRWLARWRRVVPLEEAVASLDRRYRPTGRRTAITFDDGWTGVADHAWPILQRHGLPMTLFVIADSLRDGEIDFSWVDNPPDAPLRTMALDQLRALHDEGVTIGSHSMSHADLRTLDEADCVRDLRESRELLSDAFGESIDTLAYPKGDHNDLVRRCAERAGYRWAFSLPERREAVGPMAIPRVGVYPGNSNRTLFAKTRSRYLDARLHPRWPS